jgi:hypothetical protein
MIADIYAHAERVDGDIQVLSYDVDASGVDLTLVSGPSVVPIQLKSVAVGTTTSRWDVRREIPFPKNYSPLSEAILKPDGPATDGYDGALVVQWLVLMDCEPWVDLWYSLATLPLIFLRKHQRAAAIVRACQDCPSSIELLKGDLTPPLMIGELLWFLAGMDAESEVVGDSTDPVAALTNGPILPDGSRGGDVAYARQTLRTIEARARVRWAAHMKEVSR